MHRQKWCSTSSVSEIIDKRRTSHSRTSLRLDRNNSYIGTIYFIGNKWERQTCKITSASGTTDDHIRKFLTNLLQLFLCLKTYYCLMKQHMIQHASQSITRL